MPLYLKGVRLSQSPPQESYVASLPMVRSLAAQDTLPFHRSVTYFVGENGTGKSTLLEAIAVAFGFNPEGGTRNFNFSTKNTHSGLSEYITLRKGLPARDGFFLRAESMYNVASEIERLDNIVPGMLQAYGGTSLHAQSHGESFLALVQNRFSGQGLYLLDEPEAALSPTRQLSLLRLMHLLTGQGAQFLVATHSPILMALPGAALYAFSQEGIAPVQWQETEHYVVTKEFLNNPDGMLRHLLEEEE